MPVPLLSATLAVVLLAMYPARAVPVELDPACPPTPPRGVAVALMVYPTIERLLDVGMLASEEVVTPVAEPLIGVWV